MNKIKLNEHATQIIIDALERRVADMQQAAGPESLGPGDGPGIARLRSELLRQAAEVEAVLNDIEGQTEQGLLPDCDDIGGDGCLSYTRNASTCVGGEGE